MEKFSKQIKGDSDAIYMSCPEIAAKHIASQLHGFCSAAELCCAVGVLSIQLAKVMGRVCAVDIDSKRIEDARQNAKLYGTEEKIDFIHGDALDAELLKTIDAEVVVLDPDWSGLASEKSAHVSSIDFTQPSLRKLFALAKKHITGNIVVRIPKIFDHGTLAPLGPCHIEDIIIDGVQEFRVAYFGPDISENSKESVDLG